MRRARAIALLLMMCSGLAVKAQQYHNDFENGYTWYPPWTNIEIATDSASVEHGKVCLCDTAREFGLGFDYTVADSLRGRNLRLRFEADYRFPDTLASADIVLTVTQGQETRFWQSRNLAESANDTAGWFRFDIDMNLPADYVEGGRIRSYLWNREHSRILIDNARFEITPWVMPTFLPEVETNGQPGMVVEYILDGDTVSEFHPFDEELHAAISGIDTTFATVVNRDSKEVITLTTSFYRDCKLLRQALVMPFADSSALTVYRRNMTIDTSDFQAAYYLDREGFMVGNGDSSVVSYHQTGISSTQFDTENRDAWFNLDYWRDHPLIHYPWSDSVSDHFEDVSCQEIHKRMSWIHPITLYRGNTPTSLPRIMPVPYGYASGIVFTEHADWTDLRTHRATYFGSEKITKAKNAVGGFVYYGIPTTKSVFYNNPDGITNEAISHGAFPGLQATVKGDREFERFLVQLNKLGYEICLHTPEQYTTTPGNLKEALNYMRRRFRSASWIDHGYNNGSIHNREDLVCDALDPSSEYYAAELWRQNGIRYIWNAYYEENRPEAWFFDNNLLQPYPGFGDAFPNRQVTMAPNWQPHLILWSTPSTLDIASNSNWDYYYSPERLQRIVDNHSVHLTHIYPAWVMPGRTFWTHDADSVIVAMPGMNEALARVAALRDEGQLLPMTVKTYLDYYSSLNSVVYEILDDTHLQLTNLGDNIEGFSLLCPTPIRFADNRFYEFRKTEEGYYIWFDFKANSTIIIEIK